MFKLENYSLRKRMYIVAGFGIIALVVLAGLMFYMELNAVTSMQQLKVVGGFVVIGSALIMFMAHVIGRFGDKRATTLVNGIQNIKKATSHKKLPFPVKVILAGWLLNSTVPAKMLLIWCTLLLVVSVN